MDRTRVSWTLTPDQFALAWERTDGDRIPYPLAVRLSARDTAERAAQMPALNRWCDRFLDADLAAALRVLAQPTLRIEVFGQRNAFSPSNTTGQGNVGGPGSPAGQGDIGGLTGQGDITELGGLVGQNPVRHGTLTVQGITAGEDSAIGGTTAGTSADTPIRPVRILGAVAGDIAVVAAQRMGTAPDRGGNVRMFVDEMRNLSARIISVLPENTPGVLPRLTAPLAMVGADSRNLVTVPVAGPSTPARIRKLLKQSRDGIGQIVVSVRRPDGQTRPFGVLCWIDVVGDGRYAVRTGVDVDIVPVNAQQFTGQLRPMVTAAERTIAVADRW
jgi:hypothetical protein